MHARSTQRQQLRLQRAEDPRQPLGPRLLPCHIGNEVLAEIGRKNDVVVTDQELTDAIMREARQYGAQAQQVFDMYRQRADLQAALRAPIYEDKVVDLIFGKAKVMVLTTRPPVRAATMKSAKIATASGNDMATSGKEARTTACRVSSGT